MRYVSLLSAGIAVATAALFLGAVQVRSDVQAGTPVAAGQGFVGAWRVTFETPAGPSRSLLTVMADGTLLFSGRPVSPASGGFPVIFGSAAHGAWHASGPNTAALTWVGLVTDGDGNFLAEVTDSVEATLASDGNSWSGAYSATVLDPTGNELYVGGARVSATRIVVQPVATPASTPAPE